MHIRAVIQFNWEGAKYYYYYYYYLPVGHRHIYGPFLPLFPSSTQLRNLSLLGSMTTRLIAITSMPNPIRRYYYVPQTCRSISWASCFTELRSNSSTHTLRLYCKPYGPIELIDRWNFIRLYYYVWCEGIERNKNYHLPFHILVLLNFKESMSVIIYDKFIYHISIIIIIIIPYKKWVNDHSII